MSLPSIPIPIPTPTPLPNYNWVDVSPVRTNQTNAPPASHHLLTRSAERRICGVERPGGRDASKVVEVAEAQAVGFLGLHPSYPKPPSIVGFTRVAPAHVGDQSQKRR